MPYPMLRSMLRFALASLFLGGLLSTSAQTTIWSQGFEATPPACLPTWGYTGGVVNSEIWRSGANSNRIGRQWEDSLITFNTVNVSLYSGVTLRVYHAVRTGAGPGMDVREGAVFQVQLNGGAWTTIDDVAGSNDANWTFATAMGGAAVNTCGVRTAPNPLTYAVPAGTQQFAFRVFTVGRASTCPAFDGYIASATPRRYDRVDEGLHLDDVELRATGLPGLGIWTGIVSQDWHDCRNWGGFAVPTAATPVVVDNTAFNDCVIGVPGSPPTAQCATLTVRTLSATARNVIIDNGRALVVGGFTTVQKFSGVGVPLSLTVLNGTFTANSLLVKGTGVGLMHGVFRSQIANAVQIYGSVQIDAGGLLDLSGSGQLSLTGDFIDNDGLNGFSELGSRVVFNGSLPQAISTSGFQEEFAYLTMNKTGGSDLTLNSPILVKATATLSTGLIMTSDPTGLLTVASTGGFFGASNASFIHGPLVQYGGTAGTNKGYPIGKGNGMRAISFRPVASSTTDAFKAEFFPFDPHVAVGIPVEWPLSDISYCDYWTFERAAGSMDGQVSFGWQPPMLCPILSVPDLRIAKWDGAIWRNRNGLPSGIPTFGTVETPLPESVFNVGQQWALATINSTLPIELLWFDAQPDGSQVRLDWSTASERNNDYFTIERSANGQQFEEVTRVDGAGNSVTTLAYLDYDRWPLPGTSFYRLRQTDLDGATSVSNMVPVSFSGKGGSALVVLNDVDQVIGVHDFAVGGTVEVLDMTGRLVWKGRVEMEGRSYIPTSALGTGAYVLRVSDAMRSESAPFVR